MNTTYLSQSNKSKQSKWYLVDAQGYTLGRLSTEVAKILRGKNEPSFNPSYNIRGYVIIVNTEKIDVSGRKRLQKVYHRHSGKPGGLKKETFGELQKRLPNKIVENAVRKMLPKGRLGRQIFKSLKLYPGPNHPHDAQEPLTIQI
uniref:ribosomal protein L13 n=1 Tax=Nemalion vermiculare TaxID=935621 RepID=UPI002579E6E6|nr:ribosomal protein L13 [Nemalion vermiculare]WGV34416.1 ribosomal protein L13 [Nemalion vermiculare]